MTISMYLLLITAGCFIMTWVIRVAPFVLLSRFELPAGIIKWLQFVPVCLFTALIVEGMLNQEGSTGYQLNLDSVFVAVPTVVIAFVTRSLTISVLAGMLIMAIVRFVF